jgi:hypothetical protein
MKPLKTLILANLNGKKYIEIDGLNDIIRSFAELSIEHNKNNGSNYRDCELIEDVCKCIMQVVRHYEQDLNTYIEIQEITK